MIIPSFSIDMTTWQAWSSRLVDLGPMNFYDTKIWTNYTPGYLIFLWIFGLIFHVINISTFSIAFETLIKTVTTVFDFGTAFIIYKIIVKHSTEKNGYIAAFLYLFNPAIIFNTSVWGQVDGILTFFLLLSFYLLYDLKKIELSIVVFTFSVLIKPQALLLTPVYFIAVFYLSSFKKIIRSIPYVLIIYLLTSMLFFPKNIIFGLPSLILQMLNDYAYTSLYAFNLWAIIGWWQSDQINLGPTTYQNIGKGIYLVFILLIILPLKKLAIFNNPSMFYLAIALSVLVFFLFPTRIHERYLFPFFSFFLVAALLERSFMFIMFYIIVSIIHLANLWYVYYYYQFIFNNPYFIKPIIFDILTIAYPFLSLLTILIMILSYYFFMKNFKLKLLK